MKTKTSRAMYSERIRSAIQSYGFEQYRRGYQDALDNIRKITAYADASSIRPHLKKRAKRGAVPHELRLALLEAPGLRIVEIEDLVEKRNPDIARKSIGNELRRYRGSRYQCVRGRWYLNDPTWRCSFQQPDSTAWRVPSQPG